MIEGSGGGYGEVGAGYDTTGVAVRSGVGIGVVCSVGFAVGSTSKAGASTGAP